MPKVLKITSVHCLCSISKRIDILHADKHESLLQVDSIIFDRFGQACPNYQGKFAISLCHLKKEIRNEVTLTVCYESNVLPPLSLFKPKCGLALALKITYIIRRFRAENCPVVAYIIKGE